MKSARERALDITWDFCGRFLSRSFFAQALNDDSEFARSTTKMVDAIEKGIEEDRKYCESVRAPS